MTSPTARRRRRRTLRSPSGRAPRRRVVRRAVRPPRPSCGRREVVDFVTEAAVARPVTIPAYRRTGTGRHESCGSRAAPRAVCRLPPSSIVVTFTGPRVLEYVGPSYQVGRRLRRRCRRAEPRADRCDVDDAEPSGVGTDIGHDQVEDLLETNREGSFVDREHQVADPRASPPTARWRRVCRDNPVRASTSTTASSAVEARVAMLPACTRACPGCRR